MLGVVIYVRKIEKVKVVEVVLLVRRRQTRESRRGCFTKRNLESLRSFSAFLLQGL